MENTFIDSVEGPQNSVCFDRFPLCTQAGLECLILLFLPLATWDYKCMPRLPGHIVHKHIYFPLEKFIDVKWC